MPQFLLELFSEEIPARFQKQAADDLRTLFTDKLKAEGLSFTTAVAHVTPRRLALVIDGLPLEQAARSEERKGPKIDAPQGAIDGFLKGAGLSSLDQCEQRDTPKGKVWVAVTNIPGRKTEEVLPAMIDSVLRAMPWRKSMNWGESAFRWVRPLHSILAIFDGRRLESKFELGGEQPAITFTDHVQGHRFLSSGSFAVKDFADYQSKLRDAGVILDRDERKKIIVEGARKLLAEKSLTLKEDDGLLEEVCGLVEWPVPLIGKIDDQFMSIPPEVLVTTMRNNQKYFASLDANGKMSPYFVVTANITTEDDGKAIIEGNQRVLRARFSDAKFFWDLDRGIKLIERLPALASITFHAKLGSMADKVARMEKLATSLASAIPGADAKEVHAAARLAKCDLTTGMVGEFPELQGIMGGYYARHDKHSEAIANAITEHYSPLGPNDKCPSAPVSVAVALADKLDTLTGFFGIDEKPTGSKDPYALRRAALGVLRLIESNQLSFPLQGILRTAYDSYQTALSASKEDCVAELCSFILDRLSVLLRERGIRHDVTKAVLNNEALGNKNTGAIGSEPLPLLINRATALNKALKTETGKALVALTRRATNILRIEEKKDSRSYEPVELSLLTDESEQKLFEAVKQASTHMNTALKKEDYASAMQVLLSLQPLLNAFFEKVMINVPDTNLRRERLCLLAWVRNIASKLADFSQLEGDAGAEKAKAF